MYLKHSISSIQIGLYLASLLNAIQQAQVSAHVGDNSTAKISSSGPTSGWIPISSMNSTSSSFKMQEPLGKLFKIQSRSSVNPVSMLKSTQTNNKTLADKANSSSKAFGEQVEPSLLRPLLLRGLMNAKQKLAGEAEQDGGSQGGQAEEEVEEKTIVVPLTNDEKTEKAQQFDGGADDEEASDASGDSTDDKDNKSKGGQEVSDTTKTPLEAYFKKQQVPTKGASRDAQAEGSIRLTRHEIDGLLNDREAPEFYREREQVGEGVVVGEENQAQLNTASSDHINGGPGRFFGGYPGDYSQRLSHAASGEFGGGSGFYHRYGGETGAGFHEYPDDGRLMQSPAHASEYNEYGGQAHSGYGYGPGQEASGYGMGDYGPNSGMLRAGSGDYGPPMGYEGASGGYGHQGYPPGGYPESPMLERHASELYGPSSAGHEGFGGYGGPIGYGPSGFYGSSRPMMAAADSHRPIDEYTSRLGSVPFESRAFVSNDKSLPRGSNSIMSGRLAQITSKVGPLSPVIPVDETSSASALSNSARSQTPGQSSANNHNFISGLRDQLHEPLEEDPTDSEEQSNDDQEESSRQSADSDEDHNRDRSGLQELQSFSSRQSDEDRTGPSLVLNVPPPSAESRSTVEFTRIGSAGYLAPQLGYERSSRQKVKEHRMGDAYDPANNPAHAGKYIID